MTKYIKDVKQITGDRPLGKLESVMTLEGALFTTLFDALLSSTPEKYLRINKALAPYKMAFALDYKGIYYYLNVCIYKIHLF